MSVTLSTFHWHIVVWIYFLNGVVCGLISDKVSFKTWRSALGSIGALMFIIAGVWIYAILTPFEWLDSHYQIQFPFRYYLGGSKHNFSNLSQDTLAAINYKANKKYISQSISDRIFRKCTRMVNKRNNYKAQQWNNQSKQHLVSTK